MPSKRRTPALKGSMAALLLIVIVQIAAMPTVLLASASPVEEARDFMVHVEAFLAQVFAAANSLDKGEEERASIHLSLALEAWNDLREEFEGLNTRIASQIEEKLDDLEAIVEERQGGAREVAELLESLAYELASFRIPESLRQGFVFNAMVVIGVLESSVEGYEEALSSVEELAKAEALAERGIQLYYRLDPKVLPDDEKEEIEEFIAAVRRGLEGAADRGTVLWGLKGIITELRDLIGLEEEEAPLQALLEETKRLVSQAVAEYRKGEYEEAESLVIEAYLEAYELAEPMLAEKDPQLNDEIENLLREELRSRIAQRAPISEVESLADELLKKLDQALLIAEGREAAEKPEAGSPTTQPAATVAAPGGVDVVSKTALAGVTVLAIAELAVILKLLRERRPAGAGGV
ncbi:MAG: hypothetical protein F7C07_06265 [Desulfurococcales archaeon]|nr:hypothetical protein [Desulfurococcales archaeon]